MQISETLTEEALELKLKGKLDALTAPQLYEKLRTLSQTAYVKKIVLDCQELEYISSAGVGVILLFYDELYKQNKQLMLQKPSAKVHDVLELLGVTRIVPISY